MKGALWGRILTFEKSEINELLTLCDTCALLLSCIETLIDKFHSFKAHLFGILFNI